MYLHNGAPYPDVSIQTLWDVFVVGCSVLIPAALFYVLNDFLNDRQKK